MFFVQRPVKPEVEARLVYLLTIGFTLQGETFYVPALLSAVDIKAQFPWWIRWAIPLSICHKIGRLFEQLTENHINSLDFLVNQALNADIEEENIDNG